MGPVIDEARLVERARNDPQAFGLLYEKHYEAILNYLFCRTINVAVAEDLTANTFLKAIQGLPKYKHKTAFRAWLYGIATNELRMHRRVQRRHPQMDTGEDCNSAIDGIAFVEHESLTRVEREELLARYAALHAALGELPERYQTALVLRYFEGLPYEQIAQAMGKRLGTVKSLINRGLKKLRKILGGRRATF